jgi:hypothetical protein
MLVPRMIHAQNVPIDVSSVISMYRLSPSSVVGMLDRLTMWFSFVVLVSGGGVCRMLASGWTD